MSQRPEDRDEPPESPGEGGDEDVPQGRLTVLQVIGSTLASAFGVQSSRNRERDFSRGKPSHFIVAGIVFTVLFVLGIVLIVNLVLSRAG